MSNEHIGITLSANMDVSQILGAVKTIQGGFNGLKMPANLMKDLTKEFDNLQGYIKDFQKIMGKENISKADIKNLQNLEKSINSSFGSIIKMQQQVNNTTIMTKVDSSQLDELTKKTETARKALNDAFSNIKFGENTGILQLENGIDKAVARSKTLKTAFADAFSNLKTGNIDKFVNQIDSTYSNLENKLKSGKLETTASNLIKTFRELGLINVNLETDTAQQKIDALKLGFDGIKTAIANGASGEELQQLIKNLETATQEEEQFYNAAVRNGNVSKGNLINDTERLAQSARDAAKAEREFQQATLSATQQVQQLQQSTQYFFSLRNMINLLKRGVKEAVDTIKQLDAAMTQTAVVTEFSVSDMWKKLPEYTANANALGASVKDMYKATTLYYQQGLNTEQSMNIAAETMKMARIGGLQAADATDKMTAALRGFNMELDEASAKRVNDVYSNLAAKTASDTKELGTAMQRTASIAASAGMSFEGTAAFLAQAIETTREPAENLGTAMKTIVARFTELKKNPLEIVDVEGEEVSYNKVDTALQSIGVSLKDTNGQFRALDEVFLDISARWNSLTQTQQRYVATIAAGSRQQSRFIAMMSNYDRTMELMDYANNSAGASTEQFGKTLESLEAKINKFRNAWQQFLMGIMNDSFTKGVVDGATKALGIVNKLIDTFSLGSKTIKSALSVLTAGIALKSTGRLVNSAIGGLGGLIDPKSSWREGFQGGLIGGQAAKITNPIVQAIHGLIPHIDGTAKNNTPYKHQDAGEYNKARADLNKLLGGYGTGIGKNNGKYSVGQIQSIIDANKLNEAQQKTFFQSSPGLKKNLINSLSQLYTEVGMDKKTSQGLIAGFNKGALRLDQALDAPELKTSFSNRFQEILKSDGRLAALAFKDQYARDFINKGITEKGLSETEARAYADKKLLDLKVPNKQLDEFLAKQQEFTKTEKLADTIGKVGAGFTSAGMAMQMFGNQISAVNPLLGETISKMGGLLTALGSFVNAIPSLIAMGPAVLAVGAALAVIGYEAYRINKIKKTAEEITNSFKDTQKATQENISSLKAYKSELAVLSKGVDTNGNNINLSDADYNRYLEIVESIAEINPDIVEGYNAQGRAIIDNNKALDETLEKQEQLQKEATKKYLEPESLQALINARNVNSGFKEATIGTDAKNTGREWYDMEYSRALGLKAPMSMAVQEVVSELQKTTWGSDTLSKFGIDSNNLTDEMVNIFVNNQDKISTAAADAASVAGSSFSNKLTEGFNALSEKTGSFNEAIQPVVDQLAMQVSQSPIFADLPAQIKPALQKGLKAVASTNKGAKEMSADATKLIQKFKVLSSENGKYANSLNIVEKAQNDFADSLDKAQYEADVTPAIKNLMELKEAAETEGGAYGQALSEFLENEIQKIAHFTKEGQVNITEALNTALDDIAAAEEALEKFGEATKSDYWTAAEGMKSIYDKVFETYKDSFGTEWEKHTEGVGDATFWAGAQSILSKDALSGGVDKVSERLKEMEPMLREGEEGFQHFYDAVRNNDVLKEMAEAGRIKLFDEGEAAGWFEHIPEEEWGAVAEALKMSDEMFTSMMNKARQFGAISFDNLEQVRKGIVTSGQALEGITSTNGKKAVYVKEDTMRMELFNAGYTDYDSQTDMLIRMQKEQNINLVKSIENLTKKDATKLAEDIGVKDFEGLATKLVETGQFNKDEILNIAEKAGFGGQEENTGIYDEIVQAMENPELTKQTGELESINAKLDALVDAAIGKTAEEHEAQYEEARTDTFKEGGTLDMFSQGKDASGNILDVGSFANIRNELEQTKQKYSELSDYYLERAKMATGEDKKRFERLAELYKKDAEAIKETIKKGTETFNNVKQKQKEKNQIQKDKNTSQGTRRADLIENRRESVSKAQGSSSAKPEKKETTKGATYTEYYDAKTSAEYDRLYQERNEIAKNPDIDLTVKTEANNKGIADTQQAINNIDRDLMQKRIVQIMGDAGLAKQEVYSLKDYAKANIPVVPIDGDNTKAIASIRSINGSVSTVVVPIKPDFQGTWEKEIKIKKKESFSNSDGAVGKAAQASGKDNHIPYRSAPSFGSAARGRHGTLGPKDRGGLTLTGEKGFEIAWIPSENRSMILGANGPQMLNLPSDAVVYTHEQSKDIVKQKSIPAGSHSAEAKGKAPKLKKTYTTGNNNNNNNKKDKKVDKKVEKAAKTVEDTAKKIGGVSVWWENIARKTEATQRKADKNQKVYEKYLKDLRSTLTKTGTEGQGNSYINNLNKAIKLNQDQVDKANAQLKTLDTGTAAYQKAKKVKGSKAKTKAINKANESAFNAATPGVVNISYSTGKGKKQKTKEELVNLEKYIKSQDDTYIVDQAAINSISNKEKRKAVADAANKEVNDLISKRNKAEDEIQKANEALAKFGEELYNTFFAWETELTKIWNITQKIEQSEANISRQKSYSELLTAQLNAGLVKDIDVFNKETLAAFKAEVKKESNILKQRVDSISTLQANVQKAMSTADEQQTLSAVQSKLNSNQNITTAKATADDKQAALTKAQNKQSTSSKAVAQAKAELKAAKNAQKKAKKTKSKKDDKKANAAIKAAQKKLNTANAELTKAKKAVKTAQSAFDQANEAYEQTVSNNTQLSETERRGYEEYSKKLQEQIEVQRDAQKYTTFTRNADGTVNIDFNTDALEADKLAGLISSDKIQKIEEYVKNVQDSVKELNDTYQQVTEDLTAMHGRLATLKDEWADYAKELWDYFEKKSKEDVENLRKLSTSITNALKKLLDEVKRKLDDRRRVEDNAKTEAEISKKQQRLAMLRADTSGGHQVEIAQLQQEIASAQQDYQRSLEDQLLDKLQQQADLASEQRERLIGLAEAQLNTINNSAIVDLWMANPEEYRKEIEEAFKNSDYANAPQAIREQIDTKFDEFWNGLITNQDEQTIVEKEIQTLNVTVEQIRSYLEKAGLNIKTAKSEYGLNAAEAQQQTGATWKDVKEQGGYTAEEFGAAGVSYSNARQAFEAPELKTVDRYAAQANTEISDNKKKEQEAAARAKQKEQEAAARAAQAKADEEKAAKQKAAEAQKAKANAEAEAVRRGKENDYAAALNAVKKLKPANVKTAHVDNLLKLGSATGRSHAEVLTDLVAGKPFTWKNIFKAIIDSKKINRYELVKTWPNGDGTLVKALATLGKPNTLEAIKKHKDFEKAKDLKTKFATGGLADFTGPAWLDGTKAKPELVLNAQDTKNFIALKDILSSAMKSTNAVSNSYGGDAMYEININVDHINNDYDVDKIAERVKKNIVKESGYRNVTQVRKFR